MTRYHHVRQGQQGRGGVGPQDHASAGRGPDAPAFTIIELLVVISVITLLASLVVGLAALASRASREGRIRAELSQLVTAIEAYNEAFSQYPPDNVVDRDPLFVNSVTNALFYELTGVVVTNNVFLSRSTGETLPAPTVRDVFNAEGFLNSSTDPKQVRKFMEFKQKQLGALSSSPEVLLVAVPLPWPLNRADQPTSSRGLNPWHYVSTKPTNNPASFDLWAEYVDGKNIKIIGNWSKDVLIKGRE